MTTVAPRLLAAPRGATRPTPTTRSRLLAATLLAAASGVAMVAAFPPYDLWAASVVAVALLAVALHGASARVGAWLGFVHGLVFFLPLLHWTGTYVGALPWVALAVVEASYLALMGAAGAVVTGLPGAPLWLATVWVAQEGLRSRWPYGGFGWGRLAFSQADAPTAGLAALGGAPLVSFAVALAGALLAAAVTGRGRRPVERSHDGRMRTAPAAAGRRGGLRDRLLAALVTVAVLAVGLVVPRPVDGRHVEVALVQGNVPRLGLDFNAQRAAVLTNHVAATQRLAADVAAGRVRAPALVVWPENSSDIDPLADPAAAALISRAADAVRVPMLVGAVLDGPGRFLSNAAIVWHGSTGPGERYVKRHPVPFAEYMPMRPFVRLFSPYVDRVRDFAAGDGVAALPLGPARAAPVICFEVIDDGLVRSAVATGATLITVQTNSATFGRSAESAQQLAVSRLRAVEHGRTVLSASTSGISAIIRPDGRVQSRSAIFTRQVLTGSVPLRTETTVADRVGAWPEWIMILLALGALGAAVRRSRARRRVTVAAPLRMPAPPAAGTSRHP